MQLVTRPIGLIGPAGAGKSTAARLLAHHHGAAIVPFAAPIKRMLEALGVDARHLHGSPAEKAEPLELLCGRSARQAMQRLGTEWGRDLIGPDVWVRAWTKSVRGVSAVVADDVRTPGEALAVRDAGGVVLCIVRREVDFYQTPEHPTEDFTAISADAVITNTGTVISLHQALVRALRRLGALRQLTVAAE